MMWLTMLGLIVPTIIAIVGLATDKAKLPIRLSLILLTLVGFSLAVYSSVRENAEKAREGEREQAAISIQKEALKNQQVAETHLKELQSVLHLVNVSVGDLSKLNELSGGATYYVRIAEAPTAANLQGYLRNLEQKFKGASRSKIVCIINPAPRRFELVFGRQLDVAAAAIFKQLSDSHHLGPLDKKGVYEMAWIEPETSANCL